MRRRISKRQLDRIDKGSNRDSFVSLEDLYRGQKEKRKKAVERKRNDE